MIVSNNVHLNFTDPPEATVGNITINPLTFNSLLINWTDPGSCTSHYNVTINSNSNTTEYTNITIPNLIIGSTYSFTIIPIDTVGREGPPSSSIQYIWNGMNYTVYIYSLYFL